MKKIKLFVAFILLIFGFVNTLQAQVLSAEQCFGMSVDVSENYIVTVTVYKIAESTGIITVEAPGKPTKYCSANSCTFTFNYTYSELNGFGIYIGCRSGDIGGGCYKSEGCVVTIAPL